MWPCLGAGLISVAIATILFLQDEKSSSPVKKRVAIALIVLAQIFLWAAAWVGNRPELLDPY